MDMFRGIQGLMHAGKCFPNQLSYIPSPLDILNPSKLGTGATLSKQVLGQAIPC